MIKEYLSYQQEVKGLSARTLQEYEKELRAFVKWASPRGLRWSTITKQDIDAHTRELQAAGLKPATIKRRISTIRSMYKWAEHENLVDVNPARWAQTPKRSMQIPTTAKVAAIDAYLNSHAVTTKAQEMHVAVALMLETGVRLNELIQIEAKDFNKETSSIKIVGKGRKERYVYYGERSRKALNMYKRGTQGNIITSMTAEALRWEMYKQVGPYSPGIHPHMLRHTFATEMIAAGIDLKTLSVLMGHANTTTTEIYVKANEKRLHAEYKKYAIR